MSMLRWLSLALVTLAATTAAHAQTASFSVLGLTALFGPDGRVAAARGTLPEGPLFAPNVLSVSFPGNPVNLLNGQFTPFGQVNSQFQGLKTVIGLTPAGTLTADLGIPTSNTRSEVSEPPDGGLPAELDNGISVLPALVPECLR